LAFKKIIKLAFTENHRIGFYGKSENWLLQEKLENWLLWKKLENWLLQEKIEELAFTGKNWRIGFYRKKLKNWLLQEKIGELAFTGKIIELAFKIWVIIGGQNWFKIRIIIKWWIEKSQLSRVKKPIESCKKANWVV